MEWFKGNLATILISLSGVVGTFAVSNYRISNLEEDKAELSLRVRALESQNGDVRVTLEGMSKDIGYIKDSLDKLSNQEVSVAW